MGLLCSRLLPDHDADVPRHDSRPVDIMQSRASLPEHHASDMAAARRIIKVLDDEIAALDGEDTRPQSQHPVVRAAVAATAAVAAGSLGITEPKQCAPSIDLPTNPSTVDYFALRERLVESERKLDFDYACRRTASELEQRADAILQDLKQRDCSSVYD
jgi:hypothetical protein